MKKKQSKYTVEQRHEIYKKALVDFNIVRHGLCNKITTATCNLFNEYIFNEYRNEVQDYVYNYSELHFPEFDSFYYGDNCFWDCDHDYSTTEMRKTILEFCIEITKPN